MRASPSANALPATAMIASTPTANVLRICISCLVDCSSEVNASSQRAIPVLFNVEVGLILEPALELLEQAHPLVRADNILFNCGVDLRLHPLLQVAPIVLRHGQHLADRVPRNLFLDVETAPLVGIEEDVHRVDAAEELVDVAHDALIGPGEEQ